MDGVCSAPALGASCRWSRASPSAACRVVRTSWALSPCNGPGRHDDHPADGPVRAGPMRAALRDVVPRCVRYDVDIYRLAKHEGERPLRDVKSVVVFFVHHLYRLITANAMLLTMSMIARTAVKSSSRPCLSLARTQIGSLRRFHASTSSLKSYVTETEGPVDSFEFRVKNYATDGGKVRGGRLTGWSGRPGPCSPSGRLADWPTG